MKRYLWMIGSAIAIVLAIIVAGMSYAAHFASTVNTTHKAPAATAITTTPIPSTGLQAFHIVPAQTTAAYSMYENLIRQTKLTKRCLMCRARWWAIRLQERRPARSI